VLLVWFGMRLVFWVGYAGADDQYYARYAYLLHRPPMNHMEYRLPTIFALRAGYLLLGPSEAGACLAPMLGSLAILASVAAFVGWPREMNWKATGAVLLAAVIPIDVNYASYPAPAIITGGLLAVGTVLLVRGNLPLRLLASMGLATGFMTNFLAFYYVAILCFTALAADVRRYWPAVVATVLVSGAMLAAECAAYEWIQGDALARFRTFGVQTGEHGLPLEGRAGGSAVRFFLMPLEILVFTKHFGFDLLVMTVGGFFAWRRLSLEQRILLAATFGYWLWLGYGTNVPWAYRPPSRGMHYYTPLILGASVLPPIALGHLFARRQRLGMAVLGLMLAVHVLCLAGSGRWGQRVDVSRELWNYVRRHPQQEFLADVYTMNEMYLAAGFQLPENVRCLNTRAVSGDLLVNKEPGDAPRVTFGPPSEATAILVNHERSRENPPEPEFQEFLKEHRGRRLHVVPKRYTLLFTPLRGLIEERPVMVRSYGGAVFVVEHRENRPLEQTE